jgi:hypothetical protein
MRSFLSAASLLLLACTQQEPTAGQRLVVGNPAVEREFQLAIGDTAVVGADLSVIVRALVNDSRCPLDVQCIAAGSADVELLVRQPSRDSDLVLRQIVGASPALAIVPGYTIELTSLTPYPAHAAVPIPIPDYRVGLTIATLPPVAGAPLPLTRIENSNWGGFDTTATLVIRDAVAWSAFWQRMWGAVNEAPPLPEVDFATDMIVAFASGAQPTLGYDVILTGAAEDGGVVLVQALVRAPASDCFTGQVITHPIDVARMPKRPDPVRFTATPGVVHCGP